MTKSATETALVLSGGGIRGMAHIGFIKALQEHGIAIDRVSGASAGALVGALFCNGNSTDDMLAFFKETPLFRYNYFSINKPGLIDTDRYYSVLKGYLMHDAFESLQLPLHVAATNLQEGYLREFNSGPLIKPLLASASLSPVFSPVEIEGQLYADGGILSNFPLEFVANRAQRIIGSNTTELSNVSSRHLKNALQITARVSSLMIYSRTKEKLERCDFYIQPKGLKKIGFLDKSGIEQAYEIGYNEGCKVITDFLKRQERQSAG
ncbi:MAG: hypothetical protein RLZZ242_470 [Bacteroidota bacterium]